MTRVIGQYKSNEIKTKVMKKGNKMNSHETIYWCSTWATWCFKDMVSEKLNATILDIFDIIGIMNSSQVSLVDHNKKNSLFNRLLLSVCTLSGLLPPNECTYTVHELIHLCLQIKDQGVPRVSNLYKFERVNLFLKNLLQNNASGKTKFKIFNF